MKTMRTDNVASHAWEAGVWLFLLLPVSWAWGCDNPAQHPGMAEYIELRESLRSQPRGPVELRYQVARDRLPGRPIPVKLSFWPTAPYEQGGFSVTASPGLEVSSSVGAETIPDKGSFSFSVTALHEGHHHLVVETEVTRDDVRSSRRFAIAVPVEPAHSTVPAPMGDRAMNFAGHRMKEVFAVEAGAIR